MPGSIKIDDGSGNYTILTNAGSLGSDKTITIPNETATLATTTATDLGGLVKLTSATASNSSDLTFDNFVDQSTYCEYIIVFQNIKAATDSVEFRVKFRVGGASGSDGSDTYRQAGVYYYANIATSALFNNSSITDYQTLENNCGNNDNEAIVGKASLFPATGTASASSPTILVSTTNKENFEDNLRTIQRSTFAYLTTTGIKFYMSSGNITSGSIIIYGVKL